MSRAKWCAGLVFVLTLAAGTPVLAVIVPMDLAFSTPSGDTNTLHVTIAIGGLGSDSDGATITGHQPTDLWIDFDPVTHEANVVGIGFVKQTPGSIAVGDMDFSYLFGFVQLQSRDLRATLWTPTPPGTVTGGSFPTGDHEMELNAGVIDPGTVADPIDLSANPVSGSLAGHTGTISVAPPVIVEHTATYHVTMELSVNFSEQVIDDPVVTVTANGDFEATGQFSRSVPYFGAVTPEVSTGLEQAALGATSFVRSGEDSELEWTLDANWVNGAAEVVNTFTDPNDANNTHQFHVNNADTVVTSERIDVRDYAGVQVAVDVRSWDTSTGFEGQDDVDLSVLPSYDGINFHAEDELFWLEIEGRDITDLDNGQHGAFTGFQSPLGLIPDHVKSIRVVVDVDNNSPNEHLMWDNIKVTAIPVSEMSTLTWNGPGHGPWDSTSQWTGGAPGKTPDHTTHVVVPTNTVTVEGNAAAYTLSVHSGGRVVVHPGNTLAVGPSVEVADGTLNIQGTLNAWSVNVAAGRLEVASTGTLNVGSEFTMDGGSEYACEMDASANGLIDAKGDVHLDGTLTLQPIGVGAAGDSSPVIVTADGAAGVSGNFADVPAGHLGHLKYGVFYRGINYDPASVSVNLFTAEGGDGNGDGRVDVMDITHLVANFGLPDRQWTDNDTAGGSGRGDGVVDTLDITDLVANFGTSADPGPAPQESAGAEYNRIAGELTAIPEPGTLVMVLSAALGLLLVWRWRVV